MHACKHTVAKLNTMFLTPLTTDVGMNTITIGQLFKKINKRSVPISGTVAITNNTEFPAWHFERGLPAGITTPIFIHSCPRNATLQRVISGSAGHSLLCCNQWLKNSIVNAPLITFDNQFDHKHFDFGAGNSVIQFNKIYTETIAHNPNADIAIIGTCVGAKIALEFLVDHPCTQIKAVILESPFADVKKVVDRWGQRYIPFIPYGAPLINTFFKGVFPNIKKAPNTLLSRLSNTPKNIPIFIAHLDNDSFCSNTDMWQMINNLRATGNNDIYLLVVKDKNVNHAHLNSKKVFAQATNAFLANYNLPHNAALAEQGKALLADAHTNAYATSEKDWAITIEAN